MAHEFDAFVDLLDYPMLVVTTAGGAGRAGCLVGFATQVTIAPPRYLVCLSTKNHTHRLAADAGALGVHVLDRRQHDLAALFGSETGDTVDKFARCRWSEGPYGVPLLDDAAAWFVGEVRERIPFGDHTGFVLEPVAARTAHRARLLSFSDARHLEPAHPA